MTRITFSKNSWEEYISWQNEDKKMLKKIKHFVFLKSFKVLFNIKVKKTKKIFNKKCIKNKQCAKNKQKRKFYTNENKHKRVKSFLYTFYR